MTRIRCDRTRAWSVLRTLHAARGASLDLRQQFNSDPGRFARFSQDAPHVFADLSKNLIDADIEQQLFALARECGVEQHRDAMFRGDAINTSEQRAVKHFLLRTPLPTNDVTDDLDLRSVHATLDAMLRFAEAVRADSRIADVVNIGITTTFGFWDWVGGRYSLWSAIGLPIAIAIGAQRYREFLAGAQAMDAHFRSAPLERNLPLRLGLLDVWYRNFLGFTSRSIAPYHSAMRRWPAYLQQLEMESNGKRVDAQGEAVPFGTAPVLWGEPGTNGQHAYFQMLHQGTDIVPVEFVAVRKARHVLPGHHDLLLANVLAQAQALMVGRADAGGQRDFPGNRPSTFLLLEELSPASLGALIALQEHRVFVSGSVWGINSFDQWGVELGKVLARELEPRLHSGDGVGLDGSTAGLLQRLRATS